MKNRTRKVNKIYIAATLLLTALLFLITYVELNKTDIYLHNYSRNSFTDYSIEITSALGILDRGTEAKYTYLVNHADNPDVLEFFTRELANYTDLTSFKEEQLVKVFEKRKISAENSETIKNIIRLEVFNDKPRLTSVISDFEKSQEVTSAYIDILDDLLYQSHTSDEALNKILTRIRQRNAHLKKDTIDRLVPLSLHSKFSAAITPYITDPAVRDKVINRYLDILSKPGIAEEFRLNQRGEVNWIENVASRLIELKTPPSPLTLKSLVECYRLYKDAACSKAAEPDKAASLQLLQSMYEREAHKPAKTDLIRYMASLKGDKNEKAHALLDRLDKHVRNLIDEESKNDTLRMDYSFYELNISTYSQDGTVISAIDQVDKFDDDTSKYLLDTLNDDYSYPVLRIIANRISRSNNSGLATRGIRDIKFFNFITSNRSSTDDEQRQKIAKRIEFYKKRIRLTLEILTKHTDNKDAINFFMYGLSVNDHDLTKTAIHVLTSNLSGSEFTDALFKFFSVKEKYMMYEINTYTSAITTYKDTAESVSRNLAQYLVLANNMPEQVFWGRKIVGLLSLAYSGTEKHLPVLNKFIKDKSIFKYSVISQYSDTPTETASIKFNKLAQLAINCISDPKFRTDTFRQSSSSKENMLDNVFKVLEKQ